MLQVKEGDKSGIDEEFEDAEEAVNQSQADKQKGLIDKIAQAFSLVFAAEVSPRFVPFGSMVECVVVARTAHDAWLHARPRPQAKDLCKVDQVVRRSRHRDPLRTHSIRP